MSGRQHSIAEENTFVEVTMQCYHKGQNDLLITKIKFHEHGSAKTKVTAQYVFRQTTTTTDASHEYDHVMIWR